MTALSLSWPEVRALVDALAEPVSREDAIAAIVRQEQRTSKRATACFDAAVALGLVALHDQTHWQIALRTSDPGDLLRASTLIRLFHWWRQFGVDLPLDRLPDPLACFSILGTTDVALLRTAQSLAEHLTGDLDKVSPQPAILLEMVRLWEESQHAGPNPHLFDALKAYEVFHGLLFATGIYENNRAQAVDWFVRACITLHAKNLLRVLAVQYALDADRPYREFPTRIGYIKWLSRPVPFKGLEHAQSVQTKWKRVSSA